MTYRLQPLRSGKERVPIKLKGSSTLHQVHERDRRASRSAGKACLVSGMGGLWVVGAGAWMRLTAVPIWDQTDLMRVVAVATLQTFWLQHPDAEQPLKAWFEEASKASRTQPSDIEVQYRSASILKNRRVVFDIRGNEYRLVVAIACRLQIVYVKFIGTHQRYDAIDAHSIEPS